MKKVRLYRGITVRPEDSSAICQDIMKDGLRVTGRETWKVEMQFFRDRIDELLSKPDLTTDDTRVSQWVSTHNGGYAQLENAVPATHATGGPVGATYYATRHNVSHRENITAPLLITFQTDVENLIIDGKDLMFKVFMLCRDDRGEQAMIRLYGKAMKRYWDAAMARDPRVSAAYCDLAVQDLHCVKHHLKNNILIGGSHNTLYESAFEVKLPIPAADILDVSVPESLPFHVPGIALEGLRDAGTK